MRFVIWIGVLLALYAHGATSVWKVSKGQHTIYLGGTVHVLKSSDFPLPKEFYDAYEASDLLVFETDIDALQDSQFAMALASKMFYEDGRGLRDVLSKEAYSTLKAYVVKEGYDMALFEHMKPWTVMMNLTVAQLAKLGIDTPGVDFHLGNRAQQEGKKRIGLVSVEEHIEILTSLGKGEENEMVVYTLQDMEALPEMMEWLVAHWRRGDTRRMEQEIVVPMASTFPKAYQALLVRRNNDWMQKLDTMIQQGKTAFVLVGMLHMVGNEGLLEQFRRRGYSVKPL